MMNFWGGCFVGLFFHTFLFLTKIKDKKKLLFKPSLVIAEKEIKSIMAFPHIESFETSGSNYPPAFPAR